VATSQGQFSARPSCHNAVGKSHYPHPVRDHERVADHIECIRATGRRLNLTHFQRGVDTANNDKIAKRRKRTTAPQQDSKLLDHLVGKR
jgi:hypothetical protein